ncbi:DUF4292 domain-containing protein [Winogradskyella maritima]|uniref:DUF4292 domain-containing protein n=1 Tax=Winogradskyella maritima TaxID=1517766 RepID=A0ABV8ADG9_9FLAO|nr:DUF4292 domain-containing protein [Winogradskyella maritima]
MNLRPQTASLLSRKLSMLLLLVVTLSSCSSTKRLIAEGKASAKVPAKTVMKEHLNRTTKFNTLQGRAKIDLTQNEKSQGATFSLRMEKDKVIWLSAPLNLARLMITPDRVRFYNKGDNTYFDGDFSLLSDVAGIDLDFQKVQNVLLGQAIFDLKAQPHQVEVMNNSYVLSPEVQNEIMELFYLINPSYFKLDSLQLQQIKERRFLQIDYSSYQTVDKVVLPATIKIIAVEDTEEVIIDMELKSMKLNDEVRFPFTIPSGYTEIKIK